MADASKEGTAPKTAWAVSMAGVAAAVALSAPPCFGSQR